MTEQATTTGTLVLDTATMAKALTRLSHEIGSSQWAPVSDPANGDLQRRLLGWYGRNRDGVEALSGLRTEASRNAGPLNKFLTDNGFPPMFREISAGGVGVAAILDMLVQWAVEASITSITRFDSSAGFQAFEHRAFEIPKSGAQFFTVPGQENPLVRLATKGGGAVWLMMASRPVDGLTLAETAVQAMADRQPADATWWSSVQIPTLEIDATVQLDWMLGLSAGDHFIAQAFQLLKLRMSEQGARVKVATGLATERSASRAPKPLTFDKPFIGWFTQSGSSIPIAAFYADYDSWQEPGGDLEDL